jgi:hypothetical protein
MDSEDCYATGVGEDEMIRLDKCTNSPDCVAITLPGFVTIMTEEDQKYFINWMKKEKPELM